MEYVSLLPPELLVKKAEDRRQGVIIRVVIYTFIISLMIYAFLLVSSILARNELNTINFERESVERQAEGLEEYATLYADMNNAEEVLAAAMGNVPVWNEILFDLAITFPPGTVWLSEMSVNYREGSGSINMRGWAYDHSYLASMLEEVSTMEQLSGVRCQVSTESSYGGVDVVMFTIEAVVRPGPQFIAYEEEEI